MVVWHLVRSVYYTENAADRNAYLNFETFEFFQFAMKQYDLKKSEKHFCSNDLMQNEKMRAFDLSVFALHYTKKQLIRTGTQF